MIEREDVMVTWKATGSSARGTFKSVRTYYMVEWKA